jgi:hypothetical protein
MKATIELGPEEIKKAIQSHLLMGGFKACRIHFVVTQGDYQSGEVVTALAEVEISRLHPQDRDGR